MTFLPIIRGLAISCLYVASVECANVSLGKFTISSAECRSTEDIVFEFINNDNDPKSRHTLAECDASRQFCYLRDKSQSSSYAILFTGFGAIFSVFNTFEVARGKYFCCSAVFNGDCVQLDLSLLPYTTFSGDQDHNTQEKTDRNQEFQTSRLEGMLTNINILTIFLTATCVVNSAMIFVLVLRNCRKSRKRVREYDEETLPLNKVQKCEQRRHQDITFKTSFLSSWQDTVTQAVLKLLINTIEEHTYENDITMEAPITCRDILTRIGKKTDGANGNASDSETQTALEIVNRSIEDYIKKRKLSMEAPVTHGVFLTVLENVVEQTTGANRNTRDKVTQSVLESAIRSIEEDIHRRNIAMDDPITCGVIKTLLENVVEQTTGANGNTRTRRPCPCYYQQPTTDLSGGGSPCRRSSFPPNSQTGQSSDDDNDDDDDDADELAFLPTELETGESNLGNSKKTRETEKLAGVRRHRYNIEMAHTESSF